MLHAPLKIEQVLTVPAIFGDHMVVQQGMPIRIWGSARPGMVVTGAFGNDRSSTTADARGRWQVELPPRSASRQGNALTISAGEQQIVFIDVVVGEVWLCSGQSNMEMSLDATVPSEDNLSRAEAQAGSRARAEPITIPPAGLRYIRIANTMAATPCSDCGGKWLVGTPENVRELTAIGFHFAARIGAALDVPCGIIHCAWGCSSIEAWMSNEALAADAGLHGVIARHKQLDAEFPRYRESFASQMDAWQTTNAGVIPNAAMYSRGIDGSWAESGIDGAGWLPVTRPFLRPAEIATDRDGMVWFRREIEIPSTWAGRELWCDLGIIDGQVTVFLDGEQVWAKSNRDPFHWLRPCNFSLPPGATTAGRHILAVRMLLQFCSGSPYGTADTMGLSATAAEAKMPLALGWTSRLACTFPRPEPERLVGHPPWPIGAPWDMRHPARIFNGMVAPLAGFAMQGVLWYQGETNVPHHAEYRHMLMAFIQDWRRQWRQERLHVGVVQLADFGAAPTDPAESELARLREAQQQAVEATEDAGLATAVDSGEPHDIHPRDKQRPAHRLAAWALAHVYRQGGRLSSPRLASHQVTEGCIRVVFSGVVEGLHTRDGQEPTSFTIAGADAVFRRATATIVDHDAVELRAAGLSNPLHVRYAWYDNPAVNLVDGQDYPVLPFRTDRW